MGAASIGVKQKCFDDAAVIRIYDEAGNVIETHEHKGDFKRAVCGVETKSRHAVKRDG
jgi:hypothetical protein